jgi:NADH dehydrogenase
MATIGRNRAVARVFGREIAGRLAWWVWLLVHLVFLVGFRNRATVFLNWTYHYFTYDLGLRAIVGLRRITKAQEVTRGCVSGLASACTSRHRAACRTAPRP